MKPRIIVLLFVLAAVGCATKADNVCQDISYCTTQSSDQEHACEAQAKQLAREAAASDCSSQYNAYFDCAADKYQCNGNVVSFPGCESARDDLDSCLNAQRANNACGELASKLDQCPDPADGIESLVEISDQALPGRPKFRAERHERSSNVVGEIRGNEHPEQVVILGAHRDSWDLGTGAVDDGFGVA